LLRKEFAALVERRGNREPLQHLLGTAPFRYVELAVGPGVFVPRPETEVVAGAAIDEAAARAESGISPLVVDLCTGSGAIAVSVAHEVPGARVVAVELSPEALVWAARNVAGTAVVLLEGDATAALPGLADAVGVTDVVVSNPPYIPRDAAVRDPEVLAFDPPLALWGDGADGLDVVRGVAARAAVLLRAGGLFVVEHADVQGETAVAALRAVLDPDGTPGFTGVADHLDLTGRPRYATARRTARMSP
jgi:release factor glutamine methyltransferase